MADLVPDVDVLEADHLTDSSQEYSDTDEENLKYAIETGETETASTVDEKKPVTSQEIEDAFFKQQDRTILQKVDFLFPQVLAVVKNDKNLDLTPKYQRRFRWSAKKQSLLIESFLLNVPIPPVFLYEKDLASYEVMDGRQRLSTVCDYMEGKFKLQGLTELEYLNGKFYKDLPPKIQATLRRSSLPVTIILSESHKDGASSLALRQFVFDRLNTGGQSLNPQEVRNCIYAGDLNDMLVRVARSDVFCEAWGIPKKSANEQHEPSKDLRRNRLYATMQDCAIVLRYFAFQDVKEYAAPRKTLDRYMAKNVDMPKEKVDALEKEYLSALGLAKSIYGDTLFRIYPALLKPGSPNTKGSLSVPFSDAVMLACRQYMEAASKLVQHREPIIERTQELMRSREKYDALIGSKNSREEIAMRIKLVSDVFASAL